MFDHATTGFLVSVTAFFVYYRCMKKQKRLFERLRVSPRTNARNSILMMCHYLHLGGTSDWSCREGNYFSQSEVLDPELGSNTPLVEFFALVSQTHFVWKPVGALWLFCHALSPFNLLTKFEWVVGKNSRLLLIHPILTS